MWFLKCAPFAPRDWLDASVRRTELHSKERRLEGSNFKPEPLIQLFGPIDTNHRERDYQSPTGRRRAEPAALGISLRSATEPIDLTSPQMSFGEFVSRTRLEIFLERYGATLVGERHDNVDDPRLPRGRVQAPSSVVGVKSGGDVGGQASVIPSWIGGASQDVDATLRLRHVRYQSKAVAQARSSKTGAIRRMHKRRIAIDSARGTFERFRFCDARTVQKASLLARRRVACQP